MVYHTDSLGIQVKSAYITLMKKYFFLAILLCFNLILSGCSTSKLETAPDGSSSSYERSGLSDKNEFLARRSSSLLIYGLGVAGLISLIAQDD